MENIQSDIQYEFVKSLKRKIDLENGVRICLWKYFYSFMKIKVIVTDTTKINKHNILKLVSEEMKSQTFKNLVENFNFKNGFIIKNQLYKSKLSYIFERNRDRNRPHGKVKYVGSDPNYDYGHDQAGSSWRCLRFVTNPKYELLEWAED